MYTPVQLKNLRRLIAIVTGEDISENLPDDFVTIFGDTLKEEVASVTCAIIEEE